jgi:competence protein ComEA
MAARASRWLVLILILCFFYDLGRSVLWQQEQPAPPFPLEHQRQILVRGLGSAIDGIHQNNDAWKMLDAILLTNLTFAPPVLEILNDISWFEDGRLLLFRCEGERVVSLSLEWMPAAMRMTLGIPLKMARMTEADWQDLPGIGPATAQRIELERQKSGEIYSLAQLKRINGIGEKRLEQWRPYFVSE